MPPIHQATWEPGDEGMTLDVRLTCTDDGQIKMTALSESGYEQTFSNLVETKNGFEHLIQEGQKQVK